MKFHQGRDGDEEQEGLAKEKKINENRHQMPACYFTSTRTHVMHSN